jgi:hypothetical protein
VLTLQPIASVRSARRELIDDDWDAVPTSVELAPDVPSESLDGIEEFSHAEIIFCFDRVDEAKIERGARRLRQRGMAARRLSAQRAKDRPTAWDRRSRIVRRETGASSSSASTPCRRTPVVSHQAGDGGVPGVTRSASRPGRTS